VIKKYFKSKKFLFIVKKIYQIIFIKHFKSHHRLKDFCTHTLGGAVLKKYFSISEKDFLFNFLYNFNNKYSIIIS